MKVKPYSGGNTAVAPALPYRNEPILICPVTGLPFHLSEGRWCNGVFVGPLGYDEDIADDAPPGRVPVPPPPHRVRPDVKGRLDEDW